MAKNRLAVVGGPQIFDLMLALFVGNYSLVAKHERIYCRLTVLVDGKKERWQVTIEGVKRNKQSNANWFIEGFFIDQGPLTEDGVAEGFRGQYSTTTGKGWIVLTNIRKH